MKCDGDCFEMCTRSAIAEGKATYWKMYCCIRWCSWHSAKQLETCRLGRYWQQRRGGRREMIPGLPSPQVCLRNFLRKLEPCGSNHGLTHCSLDFLSWPVPWTSLSGLDRRPPFQDWTDLLSWASAFSMLGTSAIAGTPVTTLNNA